jgi:hypothetical protein
VLLLAAGIGEAEVDELDFGSDFGCTSNDLDSEEATKPAIETSNFA